MDRSTRAVIAWVTAAVVAVVMLFCAPAATGAGADAGIAQASASSDLSDIAPPLSGSEPSDTESDEADADDADTDDVYVAGDGAQARGRFARDEVASCHLRATLRSRFRSAPPTPPPER